MLVEWQLPSGTKARTLQREFFRRAINLLRIAALPLRYGCYTRFCSGRSMETRTSGAKAQFSLNSFRPD